MAVVMVVCVTGVPAGGLLRVPGLDPACRHHGQREAQALPSTALSGRQEAGGQAQCYAVSTSPLLAFSKIK